MSTAVAILVMGSALAACGSPAHTAAPPTTQPSAGSSPASVLPTLEKAIREQNQKQWAPAVVDFLAVVKSDPTNEVAWYDLGVIAGVHGETVEAGRDYQASLNGNAGYIPALYNLAALDAAAQPNKAVTLYEQVLRLAPSNADAHLNLGFVFASLGQTAQAKAQFAAAIKLSPALASRVPVAEGGTA